MNNEMLSNAIQFLFGNTEFPESKAELIREISVVPANVNLHDESDANVQFYRSIGITGKNKRNVSQQLRQFGEDNAKAMIDLYYSTYA